MSIAGSDSGGGAGIQADLKTFEALDVFGTSAITCVTAQNPDKVTGIEPVSVELITQQIETVMESFPVAAFKTGMLFSDEIILSVADIFKSHDIRKVVVDPVMIATSGSNLLQNSAVKALKENLIPKAFVITPNIPEAEVLLEKSIDDLSDAVEAAKAISDKYGVNTVVKGGHLENSTDITDILCYNNKIYTFVHPKVDVPENHGTGCTFAAALTAFVAKQFPLPYAVENAKKFVFSALKNAVNVGVHQPLKWN